MSQPTNPQFADLSPELVRQQLRRLLAHPLFTNSRRYPVLLAFVVEQSLLGRAEELRERLIGCEAFGRTADYDVALDPIVRITAAEVRKRLVQYYYDSAHAAELVISLPLGSYLPSFQLPESIPPTAASSSADSAPTPSTEASLAAPEPDPQPVNDAATISSRRLSLRRWLVWALSLTLALVAGFAAAHLSFFHRPSELDRFWSPIATSPVRVTFCLGRPGEILSQHLPPQPQIPSTGDLLLPDVLSLARTLQPLAATPAKSSAAFRLLPASEADLSQLREGPIVLIGAYDNAWAMRLTAQLPFGFDYDARGNELISDRRPATRHSWQLQWDSSGHHILTDVALIARFRDSITGQSVILLGGISASGTEAASELLTQPELLHQLISQLPADWQSRNLAAILSTQLLDDHPGPPKILATTTW